MLRGLQHCWEFARHRIPFASAVGVIFTRSAGTKAQIPVYGRHLLGTITVNTSIAKSALRAKALELAKQQFKGPLHFVGLQQDNGTVDALDSEEVLDLKQIDKAKAFVTIQPEEKEPVDKAEFDQLKALVYQQSKDLAQQGKDLADCRASVKVLKRVTLYPLARRELLRLARDLLAKQTVKLLPSSLQQADLKTIHDSSRNSVRGIGNAAAHEIAKEVQAEAVHAEPDVQRRASLGRIYQFVHGQDV
mmetsp:Transcript_34142/g.75734  ORF Transcript_34142/g.75734 Transcript_34142/m.75734 type:complete len:247 (-) Transcript_34142:763-1503(-)|eukprot:CAMPEP_0202900986 /NCGR_PEP_ID=MMETSP1392-20130828/12585_1 /ASSEMBLY_ACC=CAM_ASM_000868 /TAXON_ID=225041 /ORGANISM="Chlamydomonas chlamydogama, Strain SAG 11-48b" /LENGTH=246 /DNA_ID=CAMNT_0049587465 /DNA_START=239 /DNA_END=979 /DNA_ORIENTATION=+